MGSHHVHGSWTALFDQVVEKDDPVLSIKGDFNPPHPNQLMFGSIIVLDGITAFAERVTRRLERNKAIKVIESYRSLLVNHNALMAQKDWQQVT
jgi:hypothetical protein